MKKIICALLCLMITLAAAGSLAAVSYTLPEKMQKQLDIGSGLKGDITLHGEGNHPLMLSIQVFQDVELQFRGIQSGGQFHFAFYQAGENEAQIGLTELYQREDRLFFRSDLLPGEVYSIPALAQIADLIRRPEGGNPSAASILVRWLELDPEVRASFEEALAGEFGSRLEMWMGQYGSVSAVRTADTGSSVLDLSYTIPMSDLKKEIVSLWEEFLQDENGRVLIDLLFDEQQKAILANENLDYFYADALAALDNDYDITYTRTVSTLGNQVSSTLELPLDEEKMGYQALTIEENGGLISYTLRNEDRLITVMFGENVDLTQVDAFSAWIITRPNPADEIVDPSAYHALRIDISHSGTISTDEESRDHERTSWTVKAVTDVSRLPEGEDPARYPEEEPIELEVKLHYFSKYSQSSPTTLEFEATLDMKDLTLTVSGQAKTASPWAFAPFETESAADLSQMTPEALTVKLAEFLAGASEQFRPMEPEEAEDLPASGETAPGAEEAAEPEDEAAKASEEAAPETEPGTAENDSNGNQQSGETD